MRMASGRTRSPYVGSVETVTCECGQPAKDLCVTKTLGAAVKTMSGYWNLYLAFFGDQITWVTFYIVDTRDGTIVWRNGRPTGKEDGNG